MALTPEPKTLPPGYLDEAGGITLKDIVDRLNFGLLQGNGTPEGVVFAGPGTIYRRLDGTAGTGAYVKESAATLATGWRAL